MYLGLDILVSKSLDDSGCFESISSDQVAIVNSFDMSDCIRRTIIIKALKPL
jgi:hypothetical protein